jgi:hypothetical protein
MAICMVFTPPKHLYTREHYEAVMEFMGSGFPPATMKMHVMGTTDAGEIRIVDIFESAEEFQEFAQGHAPLYEKMGISVDEVLKHASIFEIEKSIQK